MGSVQFLMKLRERIRARYEEYLVIVIETLASAIIGFSIGALVLYILGFNPAKIYLILFSKGLSNPDYLLSKSTPIMLTGLAFAIPMLAGVFNIGGEGQLYIGALISLIVVTSTHNSALGILAGMVAGAALGTFKAVLKVYRGVNEVIAAIMLNWVMYFLTLYLLTEKLYNPQIPHESIPVPEDARLGKIPTPIGDIRLIFFIAVIASLVIYYILYYTNIGYMLRVAGLSPKTAKYAGFNPNLAIIYSMALGGAMAGLGGSLLLIGYVYSIDTTMSTLYGLGFMGIGVALLGRNNPIGIIFSAIFFSMLIIGGEMIELLAGAPPELADALTGVIVIALALPYTYRMLISYMRIRRMMKK